MFKVCFDSVSLSSLSSLPRKSFLDILNSETYFGLIPDDLIHMIFAMNGWKIDYVISPLNFELKYNFKFNEIRRFMNTNDIPTENELDFHNLYSLDEKVADRVEFIKIYDYSLQNYYNTFVIENFDYDLIKRCLNFSGENFRYIYRALKNTRPSAFSSTKELMFNFLVRGVWRNHFHQNQYNDNPDWVEDVPLEDQSIAYWDGVVNEYMIDNTDEYGNDFVERIRSYIRNHLNLKLEGRGDMIICDCRYKNIQLRTSLGHHNFYDLDDEDFNDDDETTDMFFEKSDSPYTKNKYYVRLMSNIDSTMYPNHICDMIANRNKARSTFRTLLRRLDFKRRRKIMIIERYLATGIEQDYHYRPRLRRDLNNQIRWALCGSISWRRRNHDRMDIFPNNFRINEYDRLLKIYESMEEGTPEKVFILMKLGMLIYDSNDDCEYQITKETITNRFDDARRKGVIKYDEDYRHLGSYRSHLERCNSKGNKITYTLQMKMYRLGNTLDEDPVDITQYKHYLADTM